MNTLRASLASRWLAPAALVCACLAPPTPATAEDPRDILFFGNSFTNATCCGSTRSVPLNLRDIAVAAGHPTPRIRNASVDGQSLQWHLSNSLQFINQPIVAGEQWEDVVLQDFSTQPTRLGSTATHVSSALAVYQAVAAHSPGVKAILEETWARGPGFSYYTGPNPVFPGGPPEMQAEVRAGYHMSTDAINAYAGPDTALFAPVGDAWELAGFPRNFYASDIYHAQNRGSLLNALILYGTIYGDSTTSDINLSTLLTTLGLSAADGQLVTSLADRVLAPVPEPAALALGAIGASVLAGRRGRAARRGKS